MILPKISYILKSYTILGIIIFFIFIQKSTCAEASFALYTDSTPTNRLKPATVKNAINAYDSLMLANSYYELALIDQLQGQNSLASDKLYVAFEMYKKLHNERGIANCLMNLGSIQIPITSIPMVMVYPMV